MKNILIVFFVFALSLVLRLYNLNQIGRSWDERTLLERGYIDFMLARQGNFTDPYWYEYPDHPPLANYLYGIGAQFDLEKFDQKAVSMFYPWNKGEPIFHYDLTYSRLISVLFSSATVVLTVLFGWRYLSPFIGVLSGIMLTMIPYFLGLSQLVTYETFTAFFFTAGVFTFVEFLKSNKIKFLILSGILGGLVLEVKQSNILFFPLIVMLYFLSKFTNKKQKATRRQVLIHFLTFGIVSLVVYVLVWPMPWLHISQFISYTHSAWFSFSQSNIELYFGKVHHVPIFYYVLNLLVTIPLGVLLLFFLGINRIIKEKKFIFLAVLIWLAFPFVQSFYPLRQSGLRYIVEIYPPLSVIAAIGLEQIKKSRIRFALSVVLILYLLLSLVKISPYYLDYFNELVGGAGTVYKYHIFDLGWWGQGEKEAAGYIKTHAQKGSVIGLALDPVHTMETFSKFKYETYTEKKTYDYVVINYFATIRGGFDEVPIKKQYNLVYTVYADGAELVHVYKKRK